MPPSQPVLARPAGSPPALWGLSCAAAVAHVRAAGLAGGHGHLLYRHAMRPHAGGLEALAALPLPLPQARRLQQALALFDCRLPRLAQVRRSSDGTRKYDFVGPDGGRFEAVYVPEVAPGRATHTLCVSSQTGCAVGCAFCFTASLTRHRNLTAAEIVGQAIAVAQDLRGDGGARITNIVFMGMGEPLLNYDAVLQALRVLLQPHGADFGARRITVSTAGIAPRLAQLGAALPVRLAVSLNATDDATRSAIMPINKKYPLAALLGTLRGMAHGSRRVTIEYVLLGGVNDGVEHARRLGPLLAGIPVKVNLLPLNPHARTAFVPPSAAAVARFHAEVRGQGLPAFVRKTRGHDIGAACGQLGPQAA